MYNNVYKTHILGLGCISYVSKFISNFYKSNPVRILNNFLVLTTIKWKTLVHFKISTSNARGSESCTGWSQGPCTRCSWGSLLIQGAIRDLRMSAAGRCCAWSVAVYWGSQRLQKERCRQHNCEYGSFREQESWVLGSQQSAHRTCTWRWTQTHLREGEWERQDI